MSARDIAGERLWQHASKGLIHPANLGRFQAQARLLVDATHRLRVSRSEADARIGGPAQADFGRNSIGRLPACAERDQIQVFRELKVIVSESQGKAEIIAETVFVIAIASKVLEA